jgi:lipopolysaccharide export LptBFGC system permease protein LptF
MRLLDRYLLRELLIPFGYCLSGFLLFIISFDLINELDDFQKLKLRWTDIAEYYVIRAPELLVMVLPIALLLALLYCLTNHARHHELTAMRAAGISLGRLAAPYLAVGFVLSLALFAMNELWVPQGASLKPPRRPHRAYECLLGSEARLHQRARQSHVVYRSLQYQNLRYDPSPRGMDSAGWRA